MRTTHLKVLLAATLILVSASLLGARALAQGEEQPKETEKAKAEGGYAGYTDLEGRDEEYWTGAMAGAREKMLTLKDEIDRLDLNEEALRQQFYGRDDPYQREQIKQAWDNMLNRRATMRAELEKAEQALSDLEGEARRSGALPGWLRETSNQARQREASENKEPLKAPTYQVDLQALDQENKAADEKIYGKKEEAGEAVPEAVESSEEKPKEPAGEPEKEKAGKEEAAPAAEGTSGATAEGAPPDAGETGTEEPGTGEGSGT